MRGDLERYVLNEEDELGQGIDLRQITGTFSGTTAPTISDAAQSVTGDPVAVTFAIAPVKQVVWLRYRPTYVESLRLFGLRAADVAIRERWSSATTPASTSSCATSSRPTSPSSAKSS